MKNKKHRLLMRTGILIVFVAAVAFTLFQATSAKSSVSVGDMAPDFVLTNLQGEKVQLSDFRGEKGVMINFWGSWCKPCEKEFPHLEAVYKSDVVDNVEMLAINIGESKLVASNFAARFNMTIPILLDKKKVVTNAYNIGPIPTTFFIDKNGRIVEKVVGAMLDEAKIARRLKKIEP